jgi:hypothetical protein
MAVASILWRRLDAPGHDACRLLREPAGWVLDGTAVFRHVGAPARLAYRVVCDRGWTTRAGRVTGWLGVRPVELAIARAADGQWSLNGVPAPDLERCTDLDLGFTPATNLIPVRRLALGAGDAANAPAAWLDVAAGTLRELSQRYERRSSTAYAYEAPGVGYAGLLEVTPEGFVRRYPGLWEAER